MIFDTQTSYKAALIKTRDTHIVQMHWAGIRQWNKSGGPKKPIVVMDSLFLTKVFALNVSLQTSKLKCWSLRANSTVLRWALGGSWMKQASLMEMRCTPVIKPFLSLLLRREKRSPWKQRTGTR